MPDTDTLFPGFREHRTGPIFARVGGSGPPLLLLHGYPQTSAMWHKIAPGLAEQHTVVVADLLGYGASDSPPGDGGGEAYSKRAMASYMVDLMADLGFDTFSLAGHDRGGRVSYRLALDHSERVEQLATLDIIPTAEQFEQMGIAGGLGGFHWYFLAQPSPLPETLINGAPDYFLKRMLGSWAGDDDNTVFTEAAMAEYLAAANDPETVRSWCEDYRSGARFDLRLDRADRAAGKKITCPMLALWGGARQPHRRGRFMATWHRWATDVTGQGLDCGHFLPEELPEETEAALRDFFAG